MSRAHHSSSSSPSLDLFDEKEQLTIVNHEVDDGSDAVRFDEIIGALEDVLVDPDFVALQNDFLTRHAHLFPLPSSPPLLDLPLQFTDLHLTYQALIEPFLLSHLTVALPSFTLASLPPLIAHYQSNISYDDPTVAPYNEVIDVLVTLTDFDAFLQQMMEKREEMEEQKRVKEQSRAGAGRGGTGASLEGFGLQIVSLSSARAAGTTQRRM